MINPGVLVPLGCLSLGMSGAGLWLLQKLERQERQKQRVQTLRQPASEKLEAAPPRLPVRLLAGFGGALSRSGLLPAATLAELNETLRLAGLRHATALRLFIGAKLVSGPLIALLAAALLHGSGLSSMTRMLCIAAGAILGLLLPDWILHRRRRAYLAAVGDGLPDALDMLVICSEAGLGLELALERVAMEIEPAHPPIAAELRLTSGELRILADRRAALNNMGARTGLETLKRLGGTLNQTLQYGTPLSQALRTLAAEMRYEMLMRFEAKAARLPVLLTLPMILFILPCIFIVVGGPAGLTIANTFAHH